MPAGKEADEDELFTLLELLALLLELLEALELPDEELEELSLLEPLMEDCDELPAIEESLLVVLDESFLEEELFFFEELLDVLLEEAQLSAFVDEKPGKEMPLVGKISAQAATKGIVQARIKVKIIPFFIDFLQASLL